MTTMEGAFLIAGLVCGATCLLFLRRVLITVHLVLRGERAQGWCAKRQIIHSANAGSAIGNSRTEFTFAFRTSAGETVEFKDRPGAFGYEEGAAVRVCYDPARPHKRATIAGPDTWGPVYVRLFVALPMALVSYVALTTLAREWGIIARY
ncbi:DUF3592 domain-containing protein [Micromonospora sp. NPDC093277]|uniref:DUF3592 domain-containing protein n=1 Tax=Micromonospora sp. NPDC093277 TaxID=3364291 RepID=UPI00382AFEBB